MYVKLQDGALEIAPKTIVADGKMICNPADTELEELGYKKLQHTQKPEGAPEGKEYTFRWTEQEDAVVQEWYLIDSQPVQASIEERVAALEEESRTMDSVFEEVVSNG